MNELYLNKLIYNKSSILQAQNAYRNICTIFINENADYWICEFQNCKYEEVITIKEFENFLIDILNTRRDG